jgi:hypothetical protein
MSQKEFSAPKRADPLLFNDTTVARPAGSLLQAFALAFFGGGDVQ